MKFWKRLKYLFSKAPPKWTGNLDLRFDRSDRHPPVTVAQLHALLGEAIEKGMGHYPVEIELEYLEGLLCGMPLSTVAQAFMGKDGRSVRLKPTSGLIYLGPLAFKDWAELNATLAASS
ncbi:hypothetical protein [Aquitalea palustris]|uniref:hypothetical protein n=1 Tax=Aquitalea palustris TaxID=2480983 RepID=UPI001CF0BF37|nr:hypothetical protein [Aquitalea palustris]